MTKEEFIKRAIKVHGDKYCYDKVPSEFGVDDKITIICPIHGEFIQNARGHYRGNGCSICGKYKNKTGKTWTLEKFIEEARKVHGDKYDYSKTVYVKQSEKVIITCPIHGDFEQTPRKHLMGSGCRKCSYEKRGEQQSKGRERFIEESKAKFGDKFDYSRVNYVNEQTNIILGCKKHGWFEITPSSHLKSNNGCKKCGIEETIQKLRKDKEYFVLKANIIHNKQYSYDKFNYVNWHTMSYVTCPKHGDWKVSACNHITNKSGCPKCISQISKWEKEIYDYIVSLGIEVEQSNRTVLEGKEIDIFLPKHRIGIECDGLRWHSELYKDKNYHLDKTNKCKEKGIRLIHIFEDEWLNKKEIWKSMLSNILGISKEKIYARKCEISKVSSKDAREFLDKNHIQGYANSNENYGLFYNNELVSLMTFGKPRINLGGKKGDGNYELVRFCNKINTNVIGGASKLFKRFIKEYNPNEVVSYSDKRWSIGNLYEVLGFKHSHDSKPNYFYVDNFVRMNRFGFRKSMLVNEGFSKDKSEHEIMLERGIYRIYDCGTMVFKWLKK